MPYIYTVDVDVFKFQGARGKNVRPLCLGVARGEEPTKPSMPFKVAAQRNEIGKLHIRAFAVTISAHRHRNISTSVISETIVWCSGLSMYFRFSLSPAIRALATHNMISIFQNYMVNVYTCSAITTALGIGTSEQCRWVSLWSRNSRKTNALRWVRLQQLCATLAQWKILKSPRNECE